MHAETELLWPGAALLLLLGAVASLCVRCSRSGKGGVRPGEGGHRSNGGEDRCAQNPSQAQT